MTRYVVPLFLIIMSTVQVGGLSTAARASDGGNGAPTSNEVVSNETPVRTREVSAPSEGDDDVDPVTWQNDLAIWTAVVFVMLLTTLWLTAWRPIMEGLDRRERNITEQVEQAVRANDDAKRLLAQYRRQISEAEDEVLHMIEQAKVEAVKTADLIKKQAEAAATAEKRRALREVEAAKGKAIEEIAARSVDFAVELAGRMVEADVTPERHVQLIERAVEDFSKKKPR